MLRADPVIPASGTAGMLFACWAAAIVILLMSLVFLRSKRRDYAIAILPLVVTPLVYIFSGFASRAIAWEGGMSAVDLRIMFNVVGGLISCLLLGLSSNRIPGKRSKIVFFWSCAAFVMILTLVLTGRLLING